MRALSHGSGVGCLQEELARELPLISQVSIGSPLAWETGLRERGISQLLPT